MRKRKNFFFYNDVKIQEMKMSKFSNKQKAFLIVWRSRKYDSFSCDLYICILKYVKYLSSTGKIFTWSHTHAHTNANTHTYAYTYVCLSVCDIV